VSSSREPIARQVIGEGWTLAAAAEAAGVGVATARKWGRRARSGESLKDRSSRPRRIPHRTPAERERAVLALRAVRMTGPQIAAALSMGARASAARPKEIEWQSNASTGKFTAKQKAEIVLAGIRGDRSVKVASHSVV
jgi:transposase